MKNFVSLMMALCCSISFGWAQLSPLSSTGYSTEAPVGYWLELETVTAHSGGALDGQTTYRLYMNMQNAADYMSSCSGDADNPMILNSSSGSWYNDAANTGWNAQGINPVFFAFFPDLAYDSFLTIGAEDASTPAAQQPSAVWGATDATVEFVGGPGSNVVVDDATGGAWYTPFPGSDQADSHVAFAGEDLRVLVAQFTTAGTMSGQIQVQVFQNGDQGQEFRDLLPMCSGDGECGGCTDESASNYDPDALYDDGSCESATPGCTDATACNYDEAATEDDGSCEFAPENFDCEGNCLADIDCNGECGGSATEDALGVCGGDCEADEDGDGICDDEDDCVGMMDECGVCNGPGAIYDCGCNDQPEGDCDCEGNQLDALGVCGGDCAADADGDGICDDEDDCVGQLDECGVCNGSGPQGDCGCDELPEGDCDCEGNQLDALGVCGGDCAADADGDGICDDEDDCVGELDACGICNGPGAIYECGCNDVPSGACDCDGTLLDAIGECGGDCLVDADGDGICDDEDDCLDINGNGVCDSDEDELDCNHDADGDGIVDCEDDCPFGDFDNDGICDAADDCIGLEDILGNCNGHCWFNADGDDICDDEDNCIDMSACNFDDPSNEECTYPGCTDMAACNYDSAAGCDDESCTYPGCTDMEACNYDENAPCDDGSCVFPGCTDMAACNYDSEAGCDDGSCLEDDVCGNCGGDAYAGCTDSAACNYDPMAGCPDDSCVYPGCTDTASCTFDPAAGCDDGSCEYLDDCGECGGETYCILGDLTPAEQAAAFGIWEVMPDCGEGLGYPNEVDGGSYVYLEEDGGVIQVAGGDMLVIGTWSIDLCTCMYELPASLNCVEFEIAIDDDGLVTIEDYAEDCCLTPSDDCEGIPSPEDFLNSLEDQQVQCTEELPTECDPYANMVSMCSGESLLCQYDAAADLGYTTWDVTTAYGPGADAAIRIYGLSAQTPCLSDYFVEDADAPLTLTVFPNSGTARLTGSVHNDIDPSITFDVDMYFENAQNAAEWMAENASHGLLTAWDCEVDPSALEVYDMKNTISRLTGTGSMAGEIYLNHMPVSLNKRFQLGVGGNNHNCENGFGGWFGWQGVLDGEYVMGFSGDVIADVSNPFFNDTECGGEEVTLTYAYVNVFEGTSQYVTQHWERNDTMAPEFVDAPESYTIEWSDLHDASCGWDIPVPCLETVDNCPDWNPVYEGCNDGGECGTVTFFADTLQGDCAGNFTIFRSWTATDGSGNSTTHNQTIVVEDTIGPDFAGTPTTAEISCNDINEMVYTANDCSDVVDVWFVQDLQSGDCTNPGSLSRTYYAEDGCGNISEFYQILNIVDTEAPVIMASEVFVDCDEYDASELYPLTLEDCDLRVWTEGEDGLWTSVFNTNWSTVYDNINTPVEVSWSDAPAVAGDASCYVVNRTVTATDNCGNESSITYPINITDTTAPEIYAVPVINVEHTAYLGNGSFEATANTFGSEVIEIDDENNPFFGQTNFQVSDDCTFADYYSHLNGTITVSWVDVDSGESTCLDADSVVLNRTYTATDACGNSAIATQTVILVDTTDPVWENAFYHQPGLVSCELALLDQMNDPTYMPIPGAATDACDENLDYEVSAVLMSGGCIGTWFRTWTATDDCGNSSTAEQMITLEDLTAPTFETVPADTIIGLNEYCDANYIVEVTGGEPTVADNCDVCFDQNLVITYSESDAVVTCEGDDDDAEGTRVIERTWTVTDQCGNSADHIQYITLLDTIAPTGYALDEIVDCAEYRDTPDQLFGTVNAMDNCDSDVAISWNVEEDVIETIDAEIDSELVDEENAGCYTVTRTYHLVDDCGNMSSIEQILNVVDTIAPVYQGPGEIFIPAHLYAEGLLGPDEVWSFPVDEVTESGFLYEDGSTDELMSFPIGYIDDCSALFECTAQDFPVSGGCAEQPHPQYPGLESASWLRVLTITDLCGNTSTAEVFLHLVDTVSPYFTFVPEDYTLECDEDIVYLDPVVEDWVDENVLVTETQEIIPTACDEEYQIVRSWVARDNCDNLAYASQTITIVDTTAPEITCPADIVVESDLVSQNMSVTDDAIRVCAAANGNGDYVVVSTETYNALSDLFEAGDMIRVITGSNVQTRTITSVTNQGASLRRVNWASSAQNLVTNSNTKVELIEVAGVADNCDSEASASSAITGDEATCGDHSRVYTRTFTAVDCAGNVSTCEQTITLVDTTNPTINCPADVTIQCTQEIPTTAATAFDKEFCDRPNTPLQTSYTDEIVGQDDECGVEYTIYRTHTTTDDCGNSSSCTQIINVVDQVAPQFTGGTNGLSNNSIVEVPYDNFCGDVTLSADAILDVEAQDNCDGVDVCDSLANESANAMLDDMNIPHNPGHIAHLVDVDASGTNNPFLTGGAYTEGAITTPATLADGETCDNNPNQHGMRMFNFLGGEYYLTDAGSMVKDADGTATVSMTVSNGTGAFQVEAQFGNLMNWVEWCETPGIESYKSDCGLGDHLAWEYAILLDGTITGVEGTAFEGTELTMSHQPANHYFGFQFGEGANNKNGEYGFSGWFYYGGTLVIDGQESSAMGSGDLFGDLDFLTPWSTTLTYCVTDCAGNTRQFSYTLESTELVQDIATDGGVGGEQDAEPTVLKNLIEITTLFPNPASTHATLTVTVKEDLSAKVQVFTMDGALVEQVFDGQMYEGWPTTLELDVNSLESGMYQVRVSSKDFVTTKKLLVIE